MPVATTETGENRGEFTPVGAPPASQRMPDEHEARQSVSPPPARGPSWRRRLLIGALGVLVLAAALWFGIPWVQTSLNTVSTDDAYVNGHVTFVAARVRGQVARVLVDDNYRVHKGDLLVELDKEPFQIAVAIKKAAVDTATAELRVATAKARGIEADAWSQRWKLQHAYEDVDNQVSLLHARVAEGGSVGVSLSQTFQERRDQFHTLRLGEFLDPFNPAVASFLKQAQAFFLQQTGDPVAAQQLAWHALENLRQQQASSLAFFDTFWMMAVLTFAAAFCVFFLKRSVAEKGSHAGPE